MNVAMYMPGLRPGSMSWSIYQDFATGLRIAGIDFTLVTDGGQSTPATVEGTRFLELPSRRLDRLASAATRTPDFLAHVAGLRRFLASAPETGLLYVENVYPTGAAAHIARSRAGWKGGIVAVPMGEDILRIPDVAYGHTRFRFPRALVRRTLAGAAAIRCISPIVEDLVRDTVAPRALIPLNVADATARRGELSEPENAARRQRSRARLRERLGLRRSRTVLSLGRLHPFKGIHLLVDAMASVDDADLVVVGPTLRVQGYGDFAEHLAERARQVGTSDRVHLVGRVPHEDVLELMEGADVVVVPSLLESLNRVCVEACAAGTPFVVTRTTGVSRFIQEDGVGMVIEPRDPAAIARALNAMFEERWQRSHAASRRFVARFAAPRVAAEVAELLGEARR